MIAKSITRTITIVLVLFILLAVSAAGFYFGFTYVMSQNERFDYYDTLYGETGYVPEDIIVDLKVPPETDMRSVSAYLAEREVPLDVLHYRLTIPFELDTAGLPEYLIDQGLSFAAPYDDRGFLPEEEIIELFIPRGADTQAIAESLYEQDMISNPFVFSILSRFNGFDGAYMAGTHFLFKSMTYDEIMYSLVQKPQSVRVTFPEGLTYREIKQRLQDAQLNFDEEILDRLVQNPQRFIDYDFVRQIQIREGREWILQGYLFPDTYDFDLNTDEETIIRTFLNNTEFRLGQSGGLYYERAEQLGMTMDEVITLASIVQAETSDEIEMRMVAGVYMNRLNDEGWTMSADPTINYIRKENGLEPVMWLSTAQLEQFSDNPYNTYFHSGLPPGPINSPGRAAILAALYPENHQYYFFSANIDGGTDFARDFEQHQRNIDAYFEALE